MTARPLTRVILTTTIAVAAAGIWFEASSTQEVQPADPLGDFGARMVGSWASDDSRHEFEWGVGRRVMKSTSYGRQGDGWEIVSEGWWYWDPRANAVRGTTIAVGMGIELFEHTVRTIGDEIVHDLVTHGAMDGDFVERWTFDDVGYAWALEQEGERLMGGQYRRVR